MKRDVVEETEQLLRQIGPDWRLRKDGDLFKIVIGRGRWQNFAHHLPQNARLIVRAPALLRALVKEVKAHREHLEFCFHHHVMENKK